MFESQEKEVQNLELEKSSIDLKPFSCIVCSKSFEFYGSLQRHLQSSHDFVKCDLCDEEFETKDIFFFHNKAIHKGNGNILANQWKQFDIQDPEQVKYDAFSEEFQLFTCPRCFLSNLNQKQLGKHFQTSHSLDKKNQYQCKFCPISYDLKTNLYTHISKRHKQHFPNNLNSSKNLKMEEKIDMLYDKKTKCHICNINFSSVVSLVGHIESIHRVS